MSPIPLSLKPTPLSALLRLPPLMLKQLSMLQSQRQLGS
jgi:hypothetical protein